MCVPRTWFPSPRREGSLASDLVLSSAAAAFDQARPLLAAPRVLVGSDFDGTLSRLVADPWSAVIIPSAQRALRQLAVTPGFHVALISGRTVADLARRARVGGISYRGDHGAERAEARHGFRPAALHVQREAAATNEVAMAERLKAEVPRIVDEPWLVVEDKGPAVTFHFRSAPDVIAARARVITAVTEVDPGAVLARSGSLRACELRPPGASTKGDALSWLVAEHRPDTVFMFGDDGHDALAFDVLRALRDDGRISGLAIAVAAHADVTSDVAPRADLVLRDPAEAARFLGLLSRHTTGRA